ncbi:MAG: MraY family glycosyltransferase [bacterium]|jgi:UDP-GlcNAc:undecaprenyl-phosphate GlcNAc-1-phosphate transferase|nr:undecaprenyl/decaprenyl-phosphate alpha-N-acetylglucosaminyl 1-phosphate transferase [candidate division KSB1 bacterium]MDH7559571.1 MraY family glycosyltransferase [bacterium]
MTPWIGLAGCSLLIALSATPLCRRLAIRLGILARHNHRTIHSGRISKLGGAALFVAVVVPALVLALAPGLWTRELTGVLLASTVLFLVGAVDDVRGLGCNLKLLLQSSGALLLVAFGFKIETLVLPGIGSLSLGWASLPFTLLWIVGITNAINLIDGLDGLAVGVALSAIALAGGLAFAHGEWTVVTVAALLIASLLGFLPYNLHPASIFMGDSGSLFLGLLVAWITAAGARIGPGKVMILLPLLSLALPVTDTLWAIIRRVRRGIHPFVADREHIHHRLLNAGLSHGTASLLLSAGSLALAVAALLLAGRWESSLPPLLSSCLAP